MRDGTIRSNFYILSVIQFVCSLLVWVFCGMILEGFILFARILLVLFHVWKGCWMWKFPWWCFCFLFRVWLIFRTEWRILTRSLSFRMILVCLLTICWFRYKSRQDCRRTWALLECLELWTKLVEPQGFVICALLLGTTSDAAPHVTMIFEWCLRTRSPECMCSLWNYTEKNSVTFLLSVGFVVETRL